ncbi:MULTISPECIES: response regulator [Shewanella]|uniref:Response regulator n=1 Tax=Shewanella marisflavi TaxID=260364 RepID=A0ABX5WP10_9GAMM|nr:MULTISPECIES: response regulator [Shewanella]MCL1040910.1 response regulator [Shewanella marisflavi]QDF75876.1 response regulator [Shewanella marisflavi]
MALEDLVILLVEDDPVFRSIVAAFLVNRGATVVEADDGQQGLEKFSQQDFDIVLADLSMPILGGLDMLKQMIKRKPDTLSIVISGNQVMADVVEALRVGASDYLVKPVNDLCLIENAIRQCVGGSSQQDVQLEEFDELSYQELEEHLSLLEQNAEAARSVQQQLFPPSVIDYPKAKIDYSLFKHDEVSAYFIDSVNVGEQYLIMYMAHFHPQDNRCAFASVLLKSFVNQKLKRFRSGETETIIEPFNMLSYLNERMSKSGLDIYVDIVYAVVELTHYRASIAQAGKGLRCYIRNEEGLMPLALPDALQLGILEWGQPSTQFRNLMPGESLCVVSSIAEHRDMLLNNEFVGLSYSPEVAAGGYIQMSF